MLFEYDLNKSRRNKAVHGLDFDEAQALWRGDTVEVPARTMDEPRWLIIGRIRDQFWTAVVTYRAESIRIISVRRARHGEKEIYLGCRI